MVNVGKYTIHGCYGIEKNPTEVCSSTPTGDKPRDTGEWENVFGHQKVEVRCLGPQNDGLEKVDSGLKYGLFWVSMLDFWGVPSLKLT